MNHESSPSSHESSEASAVGSSEMAAEVEPESFDGVSQETINEYREQLSDQELLNFDSLIKLKGEYPDGLIMGIRENGDIYGKFGLIPHVEGTVSAPGLTTQDVFTGTNHRVDIYGRTLENGKYRGKGGLSGATVHTIDKHGYSTFHLDHGIGTGLDEGQKKELYTGNTIIEEVSEMNSRGRIETSAIAKIGGNEVEIPLDRRTQINEDMHEGLFASMIDNLEQADKRVKAAKAQQAA